MLTLFVRIIDGRAKITLDIKKLYFDEKRSNIDIDVKI